MTGQSDRTGRYASPPCRAGEVAPGYSDPLGTGPGQARPRQARPAQARVSVTGTTMGRPVIAGLPVPQRHEPHRKRHR